MHHEDTKGTKFMFFVVNKRFGYTESNSERPTVDFIVPVESLIGCRMAQIK